MTDFAKNITILNMTQKDETKLNEVEQTAVESENVVDGADESVSKKFQPNVVDRKGRPWLPYVITTGVLAVLTLLVAWVVKGYTRTDTWLMLGYWGDAFAIPGAVCFGVGGLVWGSNGGAFDIFAYGGRRFLMMFVKKDGRDHKYHSYYDYRESRKGKNRSFLFMIIVGGAYLIVGVVLLIVGSQLRPDYIN